MTPAVRHLLKHLYAAGGWYRLLAEKGWNREAAAADVLRAERWARSAPRRHAGIVAKGRG